MTTTQDSTKKYIRVYSRFSAGGIRKYIEIYQGSTEIGNKIDGMMGFRNKDAERLNDFLDKYSDAEPFNSCGDERGATERNIEEIRLYKD